eukprot:scaffold529_cov308-Pinguiococcus_pyrenoidosus.AAC.32
MRACPHLRSGGPRKSKRSREATTALLLEPSLLQRTAPQASAQPQHAATGRPPLALPSQSVPVVPPLGTVLACQSPQPRKRGQSAPCHQAPLR